MVCKILDKSSIFAVSLIFSLLLMEHFNDNPLGSV